MLVVIQSPLTHRVFLWYYITLWHRYPPLSTHPVFSRSWREPQSLSKDHHWPPPSALTLISQRVEINVLRGMTRYFKEDQMQMEITQDSPLHHWTTTTNFTHGSHDWSQQTTMLTLTSGALWELKNIPGLTPVCDHPPGSEPGFPSLQPGSDSGQHSPDLQHKHQDSERNSC